MTQELQVGQRWYGLRPGANAVIEVFVDEITSGTVLIGQESWGGNGFAIYRTRNQERYKIGEFQFLELLPPKSPLVPPTFVEVPASVERPSFWARFFGRG